MTLQNFKDRLRIFVVLFFLAVYGVSFYLLGANGTNLDFAKIRGAKDSSGEGQIKAPIESPIPYLDSQSTQISASFVKLCANTVHGFEISYPKNWFSSYNTEDQRCAFFAPYSFVVPQDTNSFLTPIKVEVLAAGEWLDSVKFFENPNDFRNVVASTSIEIAGRSVKRIETSSTGLEQVPKGFVSVTYLIFDGENPLVLTYQQLDQKEDIAASVGILEEMAFSIRYF